jgi:hypothetical protein
MCGDARELKKPSMGLEKPCEQGKQLHATVKERGKCSQFVGALAFLCAAGAAKLHSMLSKESTTKNSFLRAYNVPTDQKDLQVRLSVFLTLAMVVEGFMTSASSSFGFYELRSRHPNFPPGPEVRGNAARRRVFGRIP